ncbi:MAG: response regulator transcription factor [Candidatus Obscuribacterales bacterium]|nr:response regulator transcription factor [Cyanobacteria bacterium SZAS LIN-5]
MAKILLVEDDTVLAATIESWLVSEHHMVDVAYDGESGWDHLCLGGFDLAILDWNLPQVSGVDLCKRYRKQKGIAPIIMLTGRSAIAEKEEGLDSGADDYLTKPFNMKELTARIRALLRRPPMVLSNIMQVDDIIVDSAKHRVTKRGTEIHLSPRDFALIEFLMRHQDEVFSATALVQRVWQTDNYATGDAVRTAIKRIRQQLDDNDDEGNSIIENIPRVGYRLRKTRQQ